MRTGGQTAADTSGLGNQATLSGPAWVTGKSGSGLDFDGVDDSVNAGAGVSLKASSQMTVEAWIHPSTSSGCTP